MSLSLAIARGRTQCPNRPVDVSRFLIGSAASCHLRLGGSEIPAEHSMILVRPSGPVIEQLADAPPLLVNGRSVDEHALSHDDLIQIGRFQLDVIHHPAEAVGSNHSEPSIDQLADLTESWLAVHEHGGRALLSEILGRATAQTARQPQEIEHVISQLARLSQSLKTRSDHLTQREAAFERAEASLLEAQAQIEAQVGRMQQYLVDENATDENDDDSTQRLRIAA